LTALHSPAPQRELPCGGTEKLLAQRRSVAEECYGAVGATSSRALFATSLAAPCFPLFSLRLRVSAREPLRCLSDTIYARSVASRVSTAKRRTNTWESSRAEAPRRRGMRWIRGCHFIADNFYNIVSSAIASLSSLCGSASLRENSPVPQRYN
jgi:hypothetical protein